MSESRKYRKGDKVTPDAEFPGLPSATFGRVFTVEKVNPKNLRCSADDGGRGINFPADSLLPATDENVAKGDPKTPRAFVPVEFFSVGEIVTFKRPPNGHADSTPFIVFKDDGRKVNVALLGGDSDRYYRAAHAGLVRRDTAWLAESLLEEATA